MRSGKLHNALDLHRDHLVFAVGIVIFAVQNFEIVTTSFLGLKVRAPLAFQIAVVYLAGAATGGSLFELLRPSYAGSRRSMQGRL